MPRGRVRVVLLDFYFASLRTPAKLGYGLWIDPGGVLSISIFEHIPVPDKKIQ